MNFFHGIEFPEKHMEKEMEKKRGFENWWQENEQQFQDDDFYVHTADAQKIYNAGKSEFEEKVKELELELERIKSISRENYNRAEEINRIRTEEIRKLESKIKDMASA